MGLQHQPPWSLPRILPPSLPCPMSDLQGPSQGPYCLDFSKFRLRIYLADKTLRGARPPWDLFLSCKHVCLSCKAENKKTLLTLTPQTCLEHLLCAFMVCPCQPHIVGMICITSCGGEGTMPCEPDTLITWKPAFLTGP